MRTGMYLMPFDVREPQGQAQQSLGTLTLSTVGETDVVIDLTAVASSGRYVYLHYNGVGGSGWCIAADESGEPRLTKDFAEYGFDVALTAALQAAATTATWPNPSNLTASFRRDNTPIGYRLRYTGGTITATWSTDAGRALFGFSANVAVAAETLLADCVPTHCIVPTLLFASGDLLEYELDGTASHVIPEDNGAGTGTSSYNASVAMDFMQQFETRAKTKRLSAVTAHPESFERMVQYCRGERVFAVAYHRSTSHGGRVFALRTEGTRWRPERAGTTNDAHFHVNFQTVVIGDFKES